ncbi:MAG: hypothetical protein ACRENI_08015 [Gemmatimonadaceae bacterium]
MTTDWLRASVARDNRRTPGTTLVDSHVHGPPDVLPERFLDVALSNFRGARRARGAGAYATDEPPVGCLCLADIAGGAAQLNPFRDLVGRSCGRWSLAETAEPCSLIARRGAADTMILIGGRQLVTSERLEVLALGTIARLQDGLPAHATVAAANAVGAVTVLPWGFGKWWLRRGRIAARLITSVRRGDLILGDSRQRPLGVPRSRILRLADREGILILPGSDSSPWPDSMVVAGSYGAVLDGLLSLETPAAALKARLLGLGRQPVTFGRRIGLGAFLRHELRARSRRRTGSSRIALRHRAATRGPAEPDAMG